jgi:hypothetical protein
MISFHAISSFFAHFRRHACFHHFIFMLFYLFSPPPLRARYASRFASAGFTLSSRSFDLHVTMYAALL